MAKIFISYRRDDSGGDAGRLHEALVEEFGEDRVFMDLSDIAGGEEFAEVIRRNLRETGVTLVLIGKRWSTIEDEEGNVRLLKVGDFVATEVEQSLKQVKVVIPVLVRGATLPKASQLPKPLAPLLKRHAVELSADRWDYDSQRLIKAIGRSLELQAKGPRQLWHSLLATILAALLTLALWTVPFLDPIREVAVARATAFRWLSEFPATRADSEDMAIIAEARRGPGGTALRQEFRRQVAQLLNGLSRAGARVVVLDYFFEFNEPTVDPLMAESIRKALERGTEVVWGVRKQERGGSFDLANALREFFPQQLGLIQLRVRPRSSSLIEMQVAASTTPSQAGEPVAVFPSLALRALMKTKDSRRLVFFPRESQVGLMNDDGDRVASVAVRSDLSLYTGLQSWRFERFSFEDIVNQSEAGDDEFLKRQFGHRIVVVGSTIEGRISEAEEAPYGFEVQAQLLSNLLSKQYWKEANLLFSLLAFLILAAAGAVWWHRFAPRGLDWEYSKARNRAIRRALLMMAGGLLVVVVVCRFSAFFLTGKYRLVLPFAYFPIAFLGGCWGRLALARWIR